MIKFPCSATVVFGTYVRRYITTYKQQRKIKYVVLHEQLYRKNCIQYIFKQFTMTVNLTINQFYLCTQKFKFRLHFNRKLSNTHILQKITTFLLILFLSVSLSHTLFLSFPLYYKTLVPFRYLQYLSILKTMSARNYKRKRSHLLYICLILNYLHLYSFSFISE